MKLYKHPKNSDVAMWVFRKFTRGDTCYLNVRWFNIVDPANIFDMGVKEHLVMSEEKFREFEIYA